MAVVVSTAVCSADMTIQKNSSILVNVEEALADLIVVSYSTENKKFEGVLLDTQKGNLPFGVYSLHPAFSNQQTNTNFKDDKLCSVSQRFTYQEPQFANTRGPQGKKITSKGKAQKMTVRLRPRKVLCSNCKGICNENSENVDFNRKRRLEPHVDSSNVNNINTNDDGDSEKSVLMHSTLIPKLSRLQPQEISNAIKGNSKGRVASKTGLNNASDKVVSEEESAINRVTQELAFVDVSDSYDKPVDCDSKPNKNETNKQDEGTFNSVFSSAKTLKICFGEGEGTVVKIPAIVGDFNEDSGVSCDMSKPTKQSEAKAAKKALKKAKKQAKKNSVSSSVQSPKHVGALSPRNNVEMKSPKVDILQKKHKHKMKHKRKHKLAKSIRDENTSKAADSSVSVNYFKDIKKNCMKQKLSISLRRLSSNSYERRCDEDGMESESDGWESDVVPEFPATSSDRIGNKPLCVSPGDIVWGKVVGFPWWPGRVLSVTTATGAHVAWYASTTSSLMPCDSLSPFLDDYKVRFNKKKKGPYKEAVRLATIEAKKLESHIQDPLASPTHGNLPDMSPRPINVFS